MKAIIADNKSEQRKLLKFRKQLYRCNKKYVDNNYFMIREIFAGKMNFLKKMSVYPVNIKEDNGRIVCQGIIIYAQELPEYIQLCFFEALPEQKEAVDCLIEAVIERGRLNKCTKLVIGLCGHVNYGLGLLDSHFDVVNSFSSNGNPKYYNDYFRDMKCSEVKLNTYKIDTIDDRLMKYRALIDKLNRNYEFKAFDKKQFDYYSQLYTDLNNKCFAGHRYYYKREFNDDKEMLKELFLFMKEDSIIFAFKDGKPVGLIMWYPDYNKLANRGDIFGAKHFISNIFNNKRISVAKVMEFGIIEEYRKSGLPIALIQQVFNALKNYGCMQVETSWILDENVDSNSVCREICDDLYKGYVVYEKDIS